jgi:hypothetical protein
MNYRFVKIISLLLEDNSILKFYFHPKTSHK